MTRLPKSSYITHDSRENHYELMIDKPKIIYKEVDSEVLYCDHDVQIPNPTSISDEYLNKNLYMSNASIVPEGDRWKIQTNIFWEKTLKTCVLRDYKEEGLIIDDSITQCSQKIDGALSNFLRVK